MRKICLTVVCILLLFVVPVFALEVPSTHLVSVQWLSNNIGNPDLVILDVRSPQAYKAGHIPYAVNLPKRGNFQKGYMGNVKHILDTPSRVTKLFRKAGISDNSIVILYGAGNSVKSYTFVTREFWTMWTYGIKDIAILNGGYLAWKEAGESISRNCYSPAMGDFKIHDMQLSDIATWPYIYEAIATHKIQLIDAREPAHYNGIDHDRRLLKHGHIPGAIEIAYYNFVKKVGNDYQLVSPKKILSILKNDGIDINKPIIVYCNTGHLASGNWFAIRMLANIKDTKLYDASMYEYTRMPLPVVK